MTNHTVVLLAVLTLAGCATTPVQKATNELGQPYFASLCQRIEASACSPAMQAKDVHDRATAVLGELGQQTPAFGNLVDAAITNVVPAQRYDALVTAFTKGNGAPWSCGTFASLWNAQPVTCAK